MEKETYEEIKQRAINQAKQEQQNRNDRVYSMLKEAILEIEKNRIYGKFPLNILFFEDAVLLHECKKDFIKELRSIYPEYKFIIRFLDYFEYGIRARIKVKKA